MNFIISILLHSNQRFEHIMTHTQVKEKRFDQKLKGNPGKQLPEEI